MSVLSFFRQEEPRFNDVPDDKLIEFIAQDSPEFLKDPQFSKQVRSLFGQQANAAASQEELRTGLTDPYDRTDISNYNPFLASEFGRAITSGVGQYGNSWLSFGDALDSLRKNVGIPDSFITDAASKGREALRPIFAGGEAIPMGGPASLKEVHSAADLGALILERGLGQQAPQLTATALTGGAGVIAGLSPKAASILAIVLQTFPQETGGAFQEIKDRSGVEAPVTSATIGAINTFLETLGDSKMFERALGGDRLVGHTIGQLTGSFFKRAFGQAGKEGITEMAQEVGPAFAPELFGASRDPDLKNRFLTTGVLGTGLGLGLSGGIDAASVAQDYGTAALGETPAGRRRDLFIAQDVLDRGNLGPTSDQGLFLNPATVVQPGQIGLNTAPDLAPPGAVPPQPSSVLPTSSLIPQQPVDPAAWQATIADSAAQVRQASLAKANAMADQGDVSGANLEMAGGIAKRLDLLLLGAGPVQAQAVEMVADPVVVPAVEQNVPQSQPRENGGFTSLILPDGTAIAGEQAHPLTFNTAVSLGVATPEQLSGATAAFTRPDGTSWNLQGQPVPTSRVIWLDQLKAQPPIEGVQNATDSLRSGTGLNGPTGTLTEGSQNQSEPLVERQPQGQEPVAAGEVPQAQTVAVAQPVATEATTLPTAPNPDLRNSVVPVASNLTGEAQTPLGQTATESILAKVAQELGLDPSIVQVIEDKELRNEQGQPIGGQYRPGEAQPFIINSAYQSSEQSVRETLPEELMHPVWKDVSVQEAWLKVKAELTQTDRDAISGQYPPEQVDEEAAIRKVIAELESRKKTGPVRKFIAAVVKAIKRLFGVTVTTDAYEQILSKALQARSGATGEIRNSIATGRWANLEEVQSDIANSDIAGQVAIQTATQNQGQAIPPAYQTEIAALGTTREAKIAQAILSPVTDQVEMAQKLANNFSVISPSVYRLLTGVVAPEMARDIVAEASLKQQFFLQALRQGTREKLEKTSTELGKALARIPEGMIARNDASTYRGLADQLAQDYDDYIRLLILTNKQGTNDQVIANELNAVSKKLTTEYEQVGMSIAAGLKILAKEIPVTELATAAQTQAWIMARLNNNTLPRVMSQEASNWLQSTVGNQSAPLTWDKRIHERLAAVKDLASDNAQALSDIQAFQGGFGKQAAGHSARKVKGFTFAKRWSEMRAKYQKALATYQEINRDIKRLNQNYTGQEKALEILDRLLKDPFYQASVQEGVKHLEAGSTIRQYERLGKGNDGDYTGRVKYLNPHTGEIDYLNLKPDFGEEAKNVAVIKRLQADVVTWLRDSDDLVLRNAWLKELEWLDRFAFGIPEGLKTGLANFAGYQIPSAFQLQPLSRQLWQGYIDVRGPAYQRIGNRLIQPAQQAGFVTDQVDRELRRITQDHDLPIKKALKAAIATHGWSTPEEALTYWVPLVFEPIVSQNQNATSRPYKVGEWIDDEQITAEDFAAIKAYKARDNAVFNLLQKSVKESLFGLLYFNPLQTEELVGDRPLSRRSTDYGFKLPRRPLAREGERAGIFVRAWLAEGANHRQLLQDAFDWVLMGNGLLTNTDKEFSPKTEEQDRALFRKIQDAQRSNTVPFSDLDSLIQWAGTQQATTTISPAQAAAEFEIRVGKTVQSFVEGFDRMLGLVPSESLALFKKLGLPPAIVDAVGVGNNPFTTPRGRLVAPPSFYTYSSVSDQAWGAQESGIRGILALREIQALYVAQAAVKAALEKYEAKDTGLMAVMLKRLKAAGSPTFGPFSVKRRFNRSTLLEAEQRKIKYDLATLKEHERFLDRTIKGLERIAQEHVTLKEDSQGIQLLRGIRGGFMASLLSSFKSVAANTFGGIVSVLNYRRGLGNWNYAASALSMPAGMLRYVTDNMISKLIRAKWISPVFKATLQTPGVRVLSQILLQEAIRYEQNRAEAVAAGVVDNAQAKNVAASARLFPGTGGRIEEETDNPFIFFLNQLMSRLGGTRVVGEAKELFPGGADRMLNQLTQMAAPVWLAPVTKALNKAWQMRDTGTPGWDDLSNPLNHFTKEDLGVKTDTNVNAIRQMLAPIGGLEFLSLDHYKRQKASGQLEPFLTDGQMHSLAQEIARNVNLPGPANTPLISQGKGWSGEMRKWASMFSRFLINFAAVQENLSAHVFSDIKSPAVAWRTVSGAVAVILALILAGIGSEFGQTASELVLAEPRTRVSIGTVLDDPSLPEMLAFLGVTATSILPFVGERVAQAFGSSGGRPLLDTTRIVPGLGLVADLEQTLMNIGRSGDLTYPLADLARRYVPFSGALLNRALPGDTLAREATRAVRLAAPRDLERRQSAGGGGGIGVQTPQSPLLRRAVSLALSGDSAGSQKALDEAVALRVKAGATEKAARASVMSSFRSRNPEVTVFGKKLGSDERRRLLSRMSAGQAKAYQRTQAVFGATPTRGKTKRLKLTSRRRRQKLFAGFAKV